MKFPTENEVGEVRGDQRTTRQYYNVAMKECPEAYRLGSNNQEEGQ
jgi:hypothetical protein